MTAAEVVSVLKDVILACAAIAGVWTARAGLDTWRRQLRGGTEYELARRIMRSTYQLREAYKKVRHPAMWAYEMPEPPAEIAKGMATEDRRAYGLRAGYAARWKPIELAAATLETDLLEAEAIWGPELRGLLAQLYAHQSRLFVAVDEHIRVMSPPSYGSEPADDPEERRNRTEIVYQVREDDEFARDVNAAIKPIEDLLKPHLTR